MADGGNREQADGLYGRLLQRVALALEEAGEASQRPDEQALELRAVSAAELELIRAYRDGNLQWLRGWQAAAQEMAFLERQPPPAPGAESMQQLPPGRSLPALFSCALCGEALAAPFSLAGPACRRCGSRLFRGNKGR